MQATNTAMWLSVAAKSGWNMGGPKIIKVGPGMEGGREQRDSKAIQELKCAQRTINEDLKRALALVACEAEVSLRRGGSDHQAG